MVDYIFRSNGTYLGFIDNGYIFSRDGEYLGWIEGRFVWDSNGQFRGEITEIDGNKYILRKMFIFQPIPKVPKAPPVLTAPPAPHANIPPIILSIGVKDAF